VRRPFVVGAGHREVDELRLATGAVGGHHHAAGELVVDVRAEVAADHVQAQVEPGGHAGAGEHVAVVHVEHRVVHADLRVALRELRGVHPVRGGAAAVEHPGLASANAPVHRDTVRAPASCARRSASISRGDCGTPSCPPS
jgi:hypothetical protein